LAAPRAVLVDELYVYWLDKGASTFGSLWKVPK